MSDNTRTRGMETKLIVERDAQPLAGSFGNVKDFSVTVDGEIVATGFLGEARQRFDERIDGYGCAFSVEISDNFPMALMHADRAADLAAGVKPVTVNLMFILRYRDGTKTTLVFPGVAIKLDKVDASNREGYVMASFTAKCSTMQVK